MTPRDTLQRLLIEHRTAHDPASSEREILWMFERYMRGECICIKCGLRQDGPKEEPAF